MRGRRPKPTALHKLQGTLNPTRHRRDRKHEPIAFGELSEAPIDFTEAQSEIWKEALADAPAGIVKKIDRKVLAVFVEAADRHNTARNMQALIDADSRLKLLVKDPKSGALVASPYNDIMDKTANTILRCADRLGFCPTARPRIKVDPADAAAAGAEPQSIDPWKGRLRLIDGGKD